MPVTFASMANSVQSGTQRDEAGKTVRARHARTDFVVFIAVATLVVLTTAGAVIARHGTGPGNTQVKIVRMAGHSDYFSNPAVLKELERNGYRVEQTAMGSLRVADVPDLATNYDMANAGSDDAAARIVKKLAEKGTAAYLVSPYSSPIVIVTYPIIRDLLAKIGIAHRSRNDTWVFDIPAYLDVVAAKKRWTDVPGNASYPSKNRILIATTDPAQSNSGSMLIAIESHVQNNNSPVTDPAALDPQQFELIRSSFDGQGAQTGHTPDLRELFMRDGMSRFPIALFYENDYIFSRLTGAGFAENVVMYPNPTVIADNSLVWWSAAGKEVVNLLKTNPTLIELQERHGYRASADTARFVADMRAKGVPIADLADPATEVTVASLPTDDTLAGLIKAITQ